jgi:hypothetical protein
MFYFMFGYHHPDAWEEIQHDDSFDFDSTGIVPIRGPSEAAAIEWGKCLAKWYLSELYRNHPHLTYEWSPDRYACWIETSVPDGCEEVVRQLGVIDIDSHPSFDHIKRAFQD